MDETSVAHMWDTPPCIYYYISLSYSHSGNHIVLSPLFSFETFTVGVDASRQECQKLDHPGFPDQIRNLKNNSADAAE